MGDLVNNLVSVLLCTKVGKVKRIAKAVRGVDLLVESENAKCRNGVCRWWISVERITLIS